jgi:CBS domain-containing protein
MLQRLILRAKCATPAARRWVSQTRVVGGGQTTMATMLGSLPGCDVPTADHLMTVERAAQLMAEKHLDALPVIKDERVVGVFTEHDYFDKVLSASHSAVKTSKVCEVATMGARLVVAYPEDTVEGCLEVMTKKKLNAIPVVEHNGHVMGTVSMMDLTKEMFATQQSSSMEQTQKETLNNTQAISMPEKMGFSEPSHFPENITAAGGGYHDDITASMASPEQLHELYEQLKHDLEMGAQPTTKISFDSAAAERFKLDPHLEEMAANSFSEASTFPEYTPSEDGLFTQTHGSGPTQEALDMHSMTESEILKEEERYAMAQSELLNKMPGFSEPSDFPEVLPVEEAIATARKREKMSA